MGVMGRRSWDVWVRDYSRSHQHPVNRFCHTIGIPTVAGSIALGVASLVAPPLIVPAAALFIIGWTFQLVGHAFEGKPPEFLSDWRFLLVGLRWWVEKLQGRA
jgi:uncharacterized membrane protein YGL010W